jgi:hypothetical protein
MSETPIFDEVYADFIKLGTDYERLRAAKPHPALLAASETTMELQPVETTTPTQGTLYDATRLELIRPVIPENGVVPMTDPTDEEVTQSIDMALKTLEPHTHQRLPRRNNKRGIAKPAKKNLTPIDFFEASTTSSPGRAA